MSLPTALKSYSATSSQVYSPQASSAFSTPYSAAFGYAISELAGQILGMCLQDGAQRLPKMKKSPKNRLRMFYCEVGGVENVRHLSHPEHIIAGHARGRH